MMKQLANLFLFLLFFPVFPCFRLSPSFILKLFVSLWKEERMGREKRGRGREKGGGEGRERERRGRERGRGGGKSRAEDRERDFLAPRQSHGYLLICTQ